MPARPPAWMRAPLRPDWNWAELPLLKVLCGIVESWAAAGAELALAPQPIE
jgi:hypothetical protein